MALPELLRTLKEQAAERRAAELAMAQATAGRIRDESRAALGRRREAYLARVRVEEEETAQRSLSRARSEGAGRVLTARGRLLDRVRSELRARVDSSHRESLYLEVLPAEISGALERLPAGPVTVVSGPALAREVEAAVAGVGGVTCRADAEAGSGFRAISEVEPIEVDGGLESRLERGWPRLAVAVLQGVAR